MLSQIKGLMGSQYPYLGSYIDDPILLFRDGPLVARNQKGASGTYTCVGLTERASELALYNSGQGIVPNSWETISIDAKVFGLVIELTTLTPSLQYFVAKNPSVNLDRRGILQAIFDPIDFILTDPAGRRLGYTAELGRIDEFPNALYTGEGIYEQLAILEPLQGLYRLDLFGVGDQAFAALGTPTQSNAFSGFLRQGEFKTIYLAVGNMPPVLDPIGDQVIVEGSLLSISATASDPNTGDTLTYSLDTGAPSGAAIDPVTGLFDVHPSRRPGTVLGDGPGHRQWWSGPTDTATFTIDVTNVAPTGGPPVPTSRFRRGKDLTHRLVHRPRSRLLDGDGRLWRRLGESPPGHQP